MKFPLSKITRLIGEAQLFLLGNTGGQHVTALAKETLMTSWDRCVVFVVCLFFFFLSFSRLNCLCAVNKYVNECQTLDAP